MAARRALRRWRVWCRRCSGRGCGGAAHECAARAPAAGGVEATRYDRCIICLPARDEADEIAAMMLAQVLEHQGYSAQFVSVEKLASEYLELVERDKVQVVMIS